MISHIFLYLMALGLGTEIVSLKRFERFFSLVLFTLLAVLALNFYQSWGLGVTDNFTYHWINSPYNRINIDIFSDNYNYALIFPFFVISLFLVLNNAFYVLEPFKFRLNGLVILNLACLILMVCARNYTQLLVGAFAIDVLGFYIAGDMEAKKKYIFYNLIADMGLFMVFAILWGYLGNMEIGKLGDFRKLGAHKDLVAIVLLLSVFAKSGLFMFQNQFSDLSSVSFNRLNIISFCSAPVAGFLILYKAYPLLGISEYTIPLLQLFAGISLVWGFLGILLMDNAKEKAVCLNMMLYALLYGLLSLDKISPAFWGSLLILGMMLASCLMLTVIASSNENFISRMGGFIRHIKISFIVTLLVLFACLQFLASVYTETNRWWILGYASLLIVSEAYILRQIYFGAANADDHVWAKLQNPGFFYWFPLAAVSGVMIAQSGYYAPLLYIFCGAFVLFLLLHPFRKLAVFYENETVQETELLNGFYDVFVIAPIKILGRVLWLTIDFIIIERTIITALSNLTRFLIRVIRGLHGNSWLNYLFFSCLGAGITLYFFYLKD